VLGVPLSEYGTEHPLPPPHPHTTSSCVCNVCQLQWCMASQDIPAPMLHFKVNIITPDPMVLLLMQPPHTCKHDMHPGSTTLRVQHAASTRATHAPSPGAQVPGCTRTKL
jgi:hypothetical protein